MISCLSPHKTEELEDFLVSVFGEETRELAKGCISCSLSSDFRRPTFMVYSLEGKIIGAIAYSEELFTIHVYGISWVSVDEHHRYKGIGRALMQACMNTIQQKITTPSSLLLATYKGKTKLYEDFGFRGNTLDYADGRLLTKTIYPVEK